MFKALLLEESDGAVKASFRELEEGRLPSFAAGVTVSVKFSTLNYKDGMIMNGVGRLVRNYPHVPGVDFAGIVETSDHPDYRPGDRVVSTGWRVGEATWGGYAHKARVEGDWLVPLPAGLTAKRSMAIGTAGLTAMMAIMTLEDHGMTPARSAQDGEILVTGAGGGVGSVAVAVLAKLGYRVAASTGRPETHDYLRALGATSVVERAELAEAPKRPLARERWLACIDSVGGPTLAHVLAETARAGSIAAVGLAGGSMLETTVLPFLLRGVNLLGIDSVMCPQTRRRAAWDRLVKDLPMEKLDAMTATATLEELPALGRDILKGQVRGRLVIDVKA